MDGTHVVGRIVRKAHNGYTVARLTSGREATFSRFAAAAHRCAGGLHVGTSVEGICPDLTAPTLTLSAVWKEGH